MKIITVGFSKFEVSEEEAENIKKIINENKSGMIELRDGSMINLKNISSIGELKEKRKFWE